MADHGLAPRDRKPLLATVRDREPLLTPRERPDPSRLRLFGVALVVLAFLRVAVGYVAVPAGLLGAASVAATALFMVLPILALFAGAGHRWDLRQAIAIVVLGVVFQAGGTTLAHAAASPAVGGFLFALGQVGLVVWCMGVGAALACLLKDRNMLLPIAVFLSLFDTWLVFAPEGFVSRSLASTSSALPSVAYAVPKVAAVSALPEEAANGFAQNLAYVGPADLLFLAMFFTALYRFEMRPRATFLAIVPVLTAYLAVVLLFPDVWVGPIRLAALPALLPIGLTVLWVNRREFHLLRDERIITLGLLGLGIPFVAWRIAVTQPTLEVPDEARWSPPLEKPVEELRKGYKF